MTKEVFHRKILFIENDPVLLNEMLSWFRGKNNLVFEADSLKSAKTALQSVQPDMIVLDLALPDGSGLDLLRNLDPTPPVIILSELSDEKDILEGFFAGAVDYIVKPCSMRLLEARIGLRLLPHSDSVIEDMDLRIDKAHRSVTYRGKELSFTSSEFNILWFLMSNPSRFFSADEIYEQVWRAPSLRTTTIRRHLSTLRSKLKNFTNENLIVTDFGKGYAYFPKGTTS